MAWSDAARAAAKLARQRHVLAHREHRKSITALYNVEKRMDNFKYQGKPIPNALKELHRQAKAANLKAYRTAGSTYRQMQKAVRKTY